MDETSQYPVEAFASNGVLWWNLETRPDTRQRFGQESRIAAWLWFACDVGDVFTLPEAKEALGADLAKDSQHFDRRLRTLRSVGWEIPSGRDGGGGLRPEEYRLDRRGIRWWLREERGKVERFSPSPVIRRKVFDRDGDRCVICGIGSREAYPGEPRSTARLTLGHRVPQERLRQYGQRDNIDNWRTECARCNEEVRDAIPDPQRYEEVVATVKTLTRVQKSRLYHWVTRGERVRDTLDQAYDTIRMLSEDDREKMRTYLELFE